MPRTNTNVVTVLGNLAADPEAIGDAGATFDIANNEAFKPKDSEEWKEYCSYFTVKQWGPRRRAILDHLTKGSMVLVTGRLKQERFETKEGKKGSKVVIIASNVEFMPKNAGQSSGSSGADEADDFNGDEDIPF